MIYADDSDFTSENSQRGVEVQEKANIILDEHSLKVNED